MAGKRYNQLSARKDGTNIHYYSLGNYIGCSSMLSTGKFYKSSMLEVFISKNHNLQLKTKP